MPVHERTLSTFIAAVASQLPPDDTVVTTIGRALGYKALERATGVTNAHSFCDLLDQLASSCVSGSPEQRSCVVALALNKPSRDAAQTTMYIALNTRATSGSRPPKEDINKLALPLMSAQLRALWSVMQDISALARGSASPDQFDQKRDELEVRLKNVIYRYTWQKLLQRAVKHWPMVDARFRKVIATLKRGGAPKSRRTACTTLHSLMRDLVGVLQAPAASTPEGIASITTAVDKLYAYIRAYPAITPDLESPAEFLAYIEYLVNQGFPNNRLHLFRYVRKLLSLCLAHTFLFHAALSALFELWSGHSLVVKPVDIAPSKARFHADFDHCALLTKLVEDHISSLPAHGAEPITAAAFISQRIVESLATKAPARVVNVLQDEGRIAALLRSHTIDFSHVFAHCEGIFLSFFDNDPEKGRDLYMRYFGLSKLLCVACERLLDGYNVEREIGPEITDLEYVAEPYFARGCHRITYIPWTMPTWGPGVDSVRSNLLDRLYALLQELLRAPPSTKTAHVSTSTVFLSPFESTSDGSSKVGIVARLIGRSGLL